MEFCFSLIRGCQLEEFFIVKCAVGGTSLWRDWLSPSCGGIYDATAYADQVPHITCSVDAGEPLRAGWCYNELVKLTRESLELLRQKGYDPRIRGFCWMQGEADACDPATLARDVALLKERGYVLKNAMAADLFPRCSHVESIVCLTKEA